MAEEGPGEKTEAPTARRLLRAREDGQVAQSRDATGAAALLGAGAAMLAAMPLLPGQVAALAAMLGAHLEPFAAMRAALRIAALLALPPILAGSAGAVLAGLLQTGPMLRPQALLPDLSRVSPLKGFGRVFGPAALTEAVRNILKLALAAAMTVWLAGSPGAVGRACAGLLGAEIGAGGGGLAATALDWLLWLGIAALAAQALAGAPEYVLSLRKLMQRLKMSREDVRQESRESDGDPHIKARIRALRLARAKRRMMAQVPKATVIVTNPTHFAVALAYAAGAGGAAPRVVAKGADEVAARIRAMAQQHRVPIVPSPALARALFRVDLEAEIPAEHYKTVAEIIAYVWRIDRRLRAR